MKKILGLTFLLIILNSCGSKEADPIHLHKDQCEFCKMNISDGRFGSEIITDKGRVYKFDDIRCLAGYVAENNTQVASFYVNDFSKDNVLIDATTAHYILGGTVSSPMRGNVAAFETKENSSEFAKQMEATEISWDEVLNKFTK